MTSGFPNYSRAAQKGESGVNIVSRIIDDKFKWIFKRNHQEHDFGIDGQIEVVADNGSVTGQMIAVQIKYGESFFQESNKWGYVYRGELKHFNYLSNYPIPVIIIICNPVTNKCLWTIFDMTQTSRTEKAWKITIPFDNDLETSKDELLKIVFPVEDNLELLDEYWQMNDIIMESEYIHFIIDREEVKALDVTRVKSFFERLLMTKELAARSQGKVEISFWGYGKDTRELFEIEEVRRYVQILESNLKELLFFLRAKPPSFSLTLIIFCLCDAKIISSRSEVIGSEMKVDFDMKLAGEFFMRQFPGLNRITDWLGMSIDESKRITYEIYDRIGVPHDD